MLNLRLEQPKEVLEMETSREWQRQLIIFIISFAAGYFGLDRFYRGQVGLGVLKMITMGGAGVWYLVDAAIAAYRLGKLS
jgi:TM2 domain-containing membrane protein YozV